MKVVKRTLLKPALLENLATTEKVGLSKPDKEFFKWIYGHFKLLGMRNIGCLYMLNARACANKEILAKMVSSNNLTHLLNDLAIR